MAETAERARGRPVISPAADNAEKEHLFSFRYRIDLEEMQRKQKYADHSAKQIRDPLDDFATNLVAWDFSVRVVGTVRTNFARHGDLLGYETFYDMSSVGDQYRAPLRSAHGSGHPVLSSACRSLLQRAGTGPASEPQIARKSTQQIS